MNNRVGFLRALTRCGVLVLVAVLCATVITVTPNASDEPAEAAGFDPGYIISDSLFFNSGTMSESQIQSFLNSKVASCGAGSSCLRNYKQNTAARAATVYCSSYAAGTNESAARIIKKVATACGINPQVLLVTLQKEQGLITTANPSSFQMRAAMGYGCPDTAPCDAQFYGFFNQVYQAATAFQRYAANPQNYRYKAGATNAVLYHPNAGCGSSNVYIRNQATAGLYVYTPYQPNAAALAAGFGTGNACSSYGNRNFYNYFTQWFGSPNGQSQVVRGKVEAITGNSGGIQMSGWTFDEGVTSSINIKVTVNGKEYAGAVANVARADVKRAYPLQGTNHGFSLTVPSPVGSSKVCITAVNNSSQRTADLGCQTVAVKGDANTLTGHSTVLEASARGVKAEGWTVTGPTGVGGKMHFYVNGKYASMHVSNRPNAMVANFFPQANANIGYSEVLPRGVGTYNVCVYAVNAAGSAKAALQCKDVTVTSQTPVGRFDTAVVSGSTATVEGWAYDPATTAPIGIRVYLNSVVVNESTASVSRLDVQRAYPDQGTNHGYNLALTGLKEGKNTICLQAFNVQKDKGVELGCKTVTMEPVKPQGKLEGVSVSGSTVSASGWAFDPTSTASTQVTVTIDGKPVAVTANLGRPDVQRAYPRQGANHGFGYSASVSTGKHEVCVTARALSGTGTANLGCKTVTVTGGALDGRFDSATVNGATVSVSGWAFETGLKTPVSVYVYVNGTLTTKSLTTVPRADVQRVYPAQGPTHGYALSAPLAVGKNTVCTYVISADGTRNSQIGCKVVTR